MEVADLDKRRRIVAVADMKLVDLEAQPVWIERDIADGDRPMDRLRDLSGQHVAQDGRDTEKAEQPEDDDYAGDSDADTADTARRADPFNPARGPGPETPERLREHRHRRSP